MSINSTTNFIKAFFTVVAAIFCTTLITASGQTISLQQQNDYTVGTAINTPRFAVGDVNNDRLPDLVTMNQSNLSSIGPISVFLNNGAGGFGAPLNTPNVSLSPTEIAIGDFNRDGNADLAVSQTGIADGINIRLGNGTGNFLTGTSIAAERGSPGIASADFNGDGNLDLAICNNVNELRVLNGTGTGTFAAAASFPTANVCQDIKTADFNVDGRPDLAVSMRLAASDRGVQTFINNGAGFNAPINNAAAGATSMVVADFNRDCIPDLAVSQFASSILNTPIFIMLGSGSGSVTTATTVNVNNFPQQMTVGDFNRDKKVDLVLRRNVNVNPGGNNLTILPGNGNGTFGAAFEQSIALPTSTTEMQIATIDANRDGKDDLIIGRLGGFLLYHGNSQLFTKTEMDFDGDLRTDVSVFRPSSGTWFVNRSITGNGVIAQQWGAGSDRLAPADYDGDGKTDFAVYRPGAPSLAAFYILNSSTNTFRTEQFGQTGDDSSVVGDFDGDGKADPAVYRDSAIGSQSYFFYRGSLNNPNGTVTFLPWGTAGDRAVRGDFDGDGRADAAIFRPSTGTWFILQSSNNQGRTQTFGLSTDRRVPADYDGDGKTDIAVVRSPNSDWYILNSGNGSVVHRQWGANSDAPAPGDYNGDGRTEFASYRAAEGNWYIPQCGVTDQTVTKFGASGDVAVPSSFTP